MLGITVPAFGGAVPDFEKEVAPILETKCLFCHNAESAKGEFDLSTRASALAHTGALVPGDTDGSELLDLISGAKPEMPKKAAPLKEAQVKTLTAWIAAGAPWPEGRKLVYNPKRDLDWWSLKPVKEGLPGGLTLSGRNPVDAFIEKTLTEKGLKPLGEADPLTLIRRVTFDLTGLPPTPSEIDTFLAAAKSNPEAAWKALIDRLLASPAFGEKFAQHWLDLARYAETHGYDKDKPRKNAWPYRDYVIRSFNEDKPYPRFVQEQVAGDILFPGEPDAVIGLGFLAAGPWDLIGHMEVGEGKLDGRIAKHLDRDEMISATFNAFQSTTVQCAQCHHHKFDPIRMEDYYRLHAVFAAVDRADRVYAGLPRQQEEEKLTLVGKINALKQEQSKLESESKKLIDAKASGIDRRIAELKEKYGATELKPAYGYHSQIVNKADEEKWVQLDLGNSQAVSEVRLLPAYDDFANIGAGFGFPVRYRVQGANDPDFTKEVFTLLDATDRDQPNPGSLPVVAGGGKQSFRYLRLTATRLGERKDDYILALGEIEVIGSDREKNLAKGSVVSAKDSIEAGPRWGRSNLVDGIFHRELTDGKALAELNDLQKERNSIVESLRSPESETRLAAIKTGLDPLNAKLKTFPEGELVYAAATRFTRGGAFGPTEGKPRSIHLLNRGDIGSPGISLTPGGPPLWDGAPELFGGVKADATTWDEGTARADLARYLTQRDNPLVWRSITNRLWQWTFGAPLVGTPNDFGRGGMPPTHPELLDFLAASLRDDPDKSLKSIVRLLVNSDTYRRADAHDEGNAAIDGGNTLLWRANRRRMSAEEFRDSVLAVSGQLNPAHGGPPFQDFIIEKPEHSPHYQYHLHDPNDPASHRRTIYRFVVRSQPQPMLTSLDCADPSMSVPERDESTTALQALTQWNNRFVEAMSVQFADRLRREASASPEKKVDLACRLAIGRLPTDEERPVLLDHLQTYGDESFARIVFNLNAFVYVD